MIQDELKFFKNWFANYCTLFATPIQEDARNFEIKQLHTHQVCLNAVRIAADLNLDEKEILLVEAIALFHDVGRFPQYQKYKTFDDNVSVNHAALSAKVLLGQNVLKGLRPHEQAMIIRTVTLHNVFSLPGDLDEETRLFANLVRDADKLDIMRVVIEYFEQDEGSRADAVALGLPDLPTYSSAVLSCIKRGEMAKKSDLTTLNDFKLLQLAWLYNLNFISSLQIVSERRYIQKLAALLPPTDDIKEAVELTRDSVERKLRSCKEVGK